MLWVADFENYRKRMRKEWELLQHWLRGELASSLKEMLPNGYAIREGWFNRKTVNELIESHLAGQSNHDHRL